MDMEYGNADAIKRENTNVRTLRALTAKQIANMDIGESNICIIDNAEVTNVVLTGHIISARRNSTGVIFELEDTTGSVDCAFWANSPHDESILERVVVGNCVKIIGSISLYNSKRSVNASCVRIVDVGYLAYHFASVLYQSLHYRHLLEAPAAADSSRVGSSLGIPQIQRDILQVYRSKQGDNGLELQSVVDALRGKYSEGDIRDAVDSLMNNCHIYYVDGESYKTVT